MLRGVSLIKIRSVSWRFQNLNYMFLIDRDASIQKSGNVKQFLKRHFLLFTLSISRVIGRLCRAFKMSVASSSSITSDFIILSSFRPILYTSSAMLKKGEYDPMLSNPCYFTEEGWWYWHCGSRGYCVRTSILFGSVFKEEPHNTVSRELTTFLK